MDALLEHWWRPTMTRNGFNLDEGPREMSDYGTKHGNEYFSVPGHTPFIFR